MNTVNPERTAHTEHPVMEVIKERYSPYIFSGDPVEKDKLLSCLEAARWAASGFNEQPWRYIVADRGDSETWKKALSCLVEANQAWAKNAGVLILACAKKTFTYNGAPNPTYHHDLGLAGATLTLQAQALGLHVHMMAGIDADAISKRYEVPEDYVPLTAIAIGYADKPENGDPELAKRDQGARERKPFKEWVFGVTWGKSSTLI
ncbi:nitroreductase family protein [Ruficoccus amylovorans]|uniref:Nitroreductase family protein n=1 Tax=Ruficoccus amylovorans TaxID=1804625 RepID=A0A842HHB1_9BACT|nr:nitroreductase family protein [Ruficoccus amylovorans]MBC2595802.1 nitroreductase family protein [Ruficoccus amylovorans]